MKSSNHNGRRGQRRPVERSLLVLAIAQADALRSREVLRRERSELPAGPISRIKTPSEAAQRAAFAAAIARSEFGRFYFKGESVPLAKERRPERNGKG